MTVCSNCGSQQPEGSLFCNECGAEIKKDAPAAPSANLYPPTVLASSTPTPADMVLCSNCGEPLKPDSRFCDMCGTAVRKESPPLEKAAFPPPTPLSTPTVPGLAQSVQGQDPLLTPIPLPADPRPPASLGRLEIQESGAVLPFPAGKTELIIGREDAISGVFPDIDLAGYGGEEKGVSRQHARITIQGTQVFVEDLNSTNYTFVNRKKLVPGKPHAINEGDEVRVGRVKFTFHR